jgi:hypothetical protein
VVPVFYPVPRHFPCRTPNSIGESEFADSLEVSFRSFHIPQLLAEQAPVAERLGVVGVEFLDRKQI